MFYLASYCAVVAFFNVVLTPAQAMRDGGGNFGAVFCGLLTFPVLAFPVLYLLGWR